jgi:parallel beta-helix repeat protein
MKMLGFVVLGLGMLVGCDDGGGGTPGGCLQPSATAHDAVQRALIEAAPGSTVCFAAGTFSFTDELSLSVPNVTLRGAADGATVLDFSMQTVGANGLLIGPEADGAVVEDLVVENTPGDGIRADGVDGITFTRVDVRWDAPSGTNGAYGLYPVSCTDVLIDDCEVSGARDAGIYVGQSSNIIVRNSRAHENVAGIEIENSENAEVFGNTATNNTGGILIFDLPGLPAGNGGGVLVHDNMVVDNNHDNFAEPGTIVSFVPVGTGVMLLTTDRVEIRDNEIRDNQGTGIMIVSWLTVDALIGGAPPEPTFDEWPETLYVHGNTFTNNGTMPTGLFKMFGRPMLEDILWDGVIDPKKDNSDMSLSLCIQDNGSATFRNFDFNPEMISDPGMPSTDLAPHACMHASLPAVMF